MKPGVTRTVVVLAFEDTLLLDVSGPVQVFTTANEQAADRGLPPYAVHVMSPDGGLVRTTSGLSLATESLATVARTRIDTLIVAGGRGVRPLSRERRVVQWFARRARSVRRVCSVCTGAFMMAAAGLLVGRRATTHWSAIGEFSARFPDVQIDADAIYVRDGKVWTSAGVTAGIDLCLALVEDDLGHDLAMRAARQLVVFLKRPGGQSQFSTLLEAQAAGKGRFDKLHAWMADHLDADLSVDALADRAAMSPRNFARVYAFETGCTPAKFVETLRVEAARHALSQSDLRIAAIAERTGFREEERMRRAFIRRLGVAPGEYRRRFAE